MSLREASVCLFVMFGYSSKVWKMCLVNKLGATLAEWLGKFLPDPHVRRSRL